MMKTILNQISTKPQHLTNIDIERFGSIPTCNVKNASNSILAEEYSELWLKDIQNNYNRNLENNINLLKNT
eukprot:UN07100